MHATMEHMTIWGLISDASLLVKAVMVTLLLASLLSWYLIIRRGSVLRHLERQMNDFVQRFRAAPDVQALYRDAVQAGEGGIAPIFIAGVQEYQHLHSHDPAVLEGVERALQVDRASCRESVTAYSWEACTRQFVANLAVNPRPVGARGFRNRAD